MSVNILLKDHHEEIKGIISTFGEGEFSSHDFIEKFSQQFEEEYIDELNNYKKNGNAFRTVNGQIAEYLSRHMEELNLKKTETRKSENVFGNFDVIQWWKRG